MHALIGRNACLGTLYVLLLPAGCRNGAAQTDGTGRDEQLDSTKGFPKLIRNFYPYSQIRTNRVAVDMAPASALEWASELGLASASWLRLAWALEWAWAVLPAPILPAV